MLETWLRSYRPEERYDAEGRLAPELAELAPRPERRMGASPHANGGLVLVPLDIPDYADYAIEVREPAGERAESTRRLGDLLRDLISRNATQANFRLFCPDETNSNRLGAVFEVEDRELQEARPDDDHVRPGGRVMEVLSEHNCQGWLEGYLLSGRHGLFATYEAFAMVSASMAIQHAKWLQAARELEWREPVASLNVLLTSTCWRNDHNGFSHQGPGLIDTMISMSGSVVRVYLPPDANCLLSVADHCLRSSDYVNLIVIDKQPELQYLPIGDASEHCARRLDLGLGGQRGRRRGPGPGPGLRGGCSDARDSRSDLAASSPCPGAPGPLRERRRPDDAVSPGRPSSWNARGSISRAVHG